ncbi:MAG: 5-deoxy-glucuronate isomerase [Lachnospiraceae bacterium]|nr:5-deoxy-glucuronate isomerase [Lachnospiraceae bacterium]
MKRFYEKQEGMGYQEVVTKEAQLEVIGFDLIRLNPGESVKQESGEYELGLVILSGNCDVKAGEFEAVNLGNRRNVFDGKPTTVYVPRDTKYAVTANGHGMLEIGVCKVKADKRYEPFVVEPSDIVTEHRGKLNWQRDVNDIITSKYEGRVDKIVLGETYGCAGQWSSYPSHKHDTDNMPYEVNMEEIYHFKVNPGQGFGIQVMYNDDMSLKESYIVRDGDSVAIKEGYHPVAAAPGYSVYYLWVMAGNSGRKLTPCDDPKHAWVKAVEKMV